MAQTRRHTAMLAMVVLFCVLVFGELAGSTAARAVDDAGLALLSGAVAVVVWTQARRFTGRARQAWCWVAAACAGWAVGDALWSYYELVEGRAVPFPSWADLGFLSFSVCAATGLLLRPSSAFDRRGSRLRAVLDGLLITGSLFNLTWVTALGAVVDAGADGAWPLSISLAYPVTDLVLVTLVVVVVARTRPSSGLLLLGAGMGSFALADSVFVYATAAGTYGTGDLLDFGWLIGFLLIAESSLTDVPEGDLTRTVDHSGPAEDRLHGHPPTVAAALVPYLLAAVGIAVAVWQQVRPSTASAPTLAVASLLVGVLLLRQMLAVLDNRSLVARVVEQQVRLRQHVEQLHHQAFHDALTGLANRAMFYDRLEHVVALHRRDLRPASVMLCDLDDFKSVNDTLGHMVGDQLLVRLAERLRAATRTGDTVARLGGDEFAVLVEDDGDPVELAGRILQALDQPVSLEGRALRAGASIGIARLDPDAPADAAELLVRADVAMYQAKRDGKGRVRVFAGQTRISKAPGRGARPAWPGPARSLATRPAGAEAGPLSRTPDLDSTPQGY